MIKAITRIDPNAQVTVSDNDFNTIVWHDGNPNNITLAQIQTAQAEIQAEYDAQEYARNRATAYPSDGDFKEAYTEKEIGGDSTKWDAYVIAYNKVRTDNPK